MKSRSSVDKIVDSLIGLPVGQVRQFVTVSDGRTGVVMANDQAGGVFRGHCDLWFGKFKEDGEPLVEQLCIMDDWETITCPLGTLAGELT